MEVWIVNGGSNRGATQNESIQRVLQGTDVASPRDGFSLVLVLVEGEESTVAFLLDGGLGILASHKTERYGPLRW